MVSSTLPDELFDGRVKLLKCQRERLKWMKETYDMSYRALAKQYGISKSQAQYICVPESMENKNRHNANNSSRYYNKDKSRVFISNNRGKKRQLNKLFAKIINGPQESGVSE